MFLFPIQMVKEKLRKSVPNLSNSALKMCNKSMNDNRMVSSCPNPLLDESPKSDLVKTDTKYRGYSGSFAEKIRPKSLFCDTIYLRSLDIKLQKQPFSSLNKSKDNLDESAKSINEDTVKRKLFDDIKNEEFDKDNDVFLPNQSSEMSAQSSVLKGNLVTGSTGKINVISKPKTTGHQKHSSVSFSTESHADLVSPYTCSLSESSEQSNFPTKMKPKCDIDLSKLRQKREKRKSVHEDLQGLPFADEEKMLSPVDPVVSADGFATPKQGSECKDVPNPALNSYKTPDLVDEERYLKMQSTAEQEKARQEARARARLKSDEELGLSPNNYRKKYRRQLSLNSINYDELCSDEFFEQDDELEDDMISNFCQVNNNGIEGTFSMFKNTNLYSKGKSEDASLKSSQQTEQPKLTNHFSSNSHEYPTSSNTSKLPEQKAEVEKTQQGQVIKTMHSSLASLSETSPDTFYEISVTPKAQTKTKDKTTPTEGSSEEDKTKNSKKSIFSILNFSKGNVSKEKMKQKCKSSEKDLSTSLPSDIGSRSAAKSKTFSHLKLAKTKDKSNKLKAKSVPLESIPTTPVEKIVSQENTFDATYIPQTAKIIPKYTVYRNPETTISTFPVHLPAPKMENGLAPKASEDSFSEEDDTQGSKAGHIPSSDIKSNEKEKKVQRIVQKVQRQQVLKRLRNAQEIQRRLEELEIQRDQLEQRGVELEKVLRGEQNVVGYVKEEAEIEWYTLVHTKNKLSREFQELLIRLKDLELEDRHCRLQQEITERMAEGSQKNATQLIEERKILDEMLKIVDKRNELVAVLEQLRLREEEDEKNLNSDIFTKGTKSPQSPSRS